MPENKWRTSRWDYLETGRPPSFRTVFGINWKGDE